MNCVVISLLKGIEGGIIKLSMFFQLSISNIIIKKHKVASCYKLKRTPEPSCGGAEPVIWGDGKDGTLASASAGPGRQCSLWRGGEGAAGCHVPMVRSGGTSHVPSGLTFRPPHGMQVLSSRSYRWGGKFRCLAQPEPAPWLPATFPER